MTGSWSCRVLCLDNAAANITPLFVAIRLSHFSLGAAQNSSLKTLPVHPNTLAFNVVIQGSVRTQGKVTACPSELNCIFKQPVIYFLLHDLCPANSDTTISYILYWLLLVRRKLCIDDASGPTGSFWRSPCLNQVISFLTQFVLFTAGFLLVSCLACISTLKMERESLKRPWTSNTLYGVTSFKIRVFNCSAPSNTCVYEAHTIKA